MCSRYACFTKALFFVLLFSLPIHALFTSPPIANVTAHNAALAPSLENSFDPTDAKSGAVQFDFYGTNMDWVRIEMHVNLSLISASAELLALDPSVDNAISSAHGPMLIFAWGNESLPLDAKDWEGDDCTEYEVNRSVDRSATITFSYGNISEQVTTTSNTVPVPGGILGEMKKTSGKGQLEIGLQARFNFTYTVNDQRPSFEGGCSDHILNFSSVINLEQRKNWSVEGDRTLFFLRSPILEEQWFRNNRFDSVVFSSTRFYQGEISADGNQSFSFHLSDFNITNDSYDLWYIQSIPLGQSGASANTAYNAPSPIDPNNFSYSYLYEFNYSYDGIGRKTLDLHAVSFFNDDYRYSREILSRMLSHSGNISELGGPANETISRKSLAFSADSSRGVTIALGLIGILLIVLLANRFFKK